MFRTFISYNSGTPLKPDTIGNLKKDIIPHSEVILKGICTMSIKHESCTLLYSHVKGLYGPMYLLLYTGMNF